MLAYCGLFSLHLLAWTISLTLNLENKAAMSKRTKFNALKISLHLKQNNRSMPGLLSYCWDNVSAWKACNICNGETSESMKRTHTHKMKRKKKKTFRRFRTLLIKLLRLWWFNPHQNTFIVCLYNCTLALFSSELLSLSNLVLSGCIYLYEPVDRH